MMGKIMMAILAMLMFSGAGMAERVVVATFGGKGVSSSAVDKAFAVSGKKAAIINQTYELLRYDFLITRTPKAKQEFLKFLRERTRVCEQWARKKSIDYCGKPIPPAEDKDTSYTGCQWAVIDWVFVQEGCNFDELR